MSVKWDGLEEFKADLQRLPETLADASEDSVFDATNSAASELINAYPIGDTGNLRKGVRKTFKRTPGGAVGEVRSTAPHAFIWEYGTVVRKTRQGWLRGRMKSAKERSLERLGTIASRERKQMNERIADVLRRAGFELSGS